MSSLAVNFLKAIAYLPLLAFLGAILTAAALTAVNTEGVKGAAHNVISNTRKIANATAANQHDAVFLQVVLFAGDVGGDFLAVAQTNAGDLAKRRVRLLRSHRLDLQAHATLLRAGFKVLNLINAS